MPRFLGTGSGTKLNNPNIGWKRAENYARDIMGDLNNWVAGWTDWNLVLDLKGGPNWVYFFNI
jgi:glucosylceramidase